VIGNNIAMFDELISVWGNHLIKEIPLYIIMNKQDLPNLVDINFIRTILRKNNLKIKSKYPPIYATCALLKKTQNIKIIFQEIFNKL